MARRGLTLPTTDAPVGPAKPLSFREFVTQVKPRYRWYKHCEVLADVLQRVADGEIKRLMVFMPPRHGKSEEVSRLFSAYWLYLHPDQWVGLTCYGADLAYTLSRASQEYYLASGCKLKGNSSAVKHWETQAGGGLWAAGVGGPITGKGWHLGIIDDPVKNDVTAASEVIQVRQREWYQSTFTTREEPNSDDDPDGALVLIQTRWNEGDLGGWMLSEELVDDEPEGWHIVCFPAIKEDTDQVFPLSCTVEPDWRQPGEALCPERRPLTKLNRIAKRLHAYFWSALFQQRPTPIAGDLFQPQWFTIVAALPAGCKFVRYWDKAGTKGGGAYTAGVLMAMSPDRKFYLCDVVRGQWAAHEREKMIKQTTELDGIAVDVWVEQEPGSSGLESGQNTVINLAGFTAKADRVTGEKEVRAQPFAAQAGVGNVFMLRDRESNRWNRPFLDEARSFPNGRYKDQIDAASGAFNKLALAGSGTLTLLSDPYADERW
jgi:predicted phage terminase large subunit-like protein